METFENETNTTQYEFAGIRIRFIARIIDVLILMFITIGVIYLLSLNIDSISKLLNAILLLMSYLFVALLISWFYYTFTTSKFGGTPGKLLTGLTVINEDGGHLSIKKSFFRHTIGYAISNLLFGFGYLWIIRDEQKQGWHDMVSSTYVIKNDFGAVRYLTGILAIIVILITLSFTGIGIYRNVKNTKKLQSEYKELLVYLTQYFQSYEEEVEEGLFDQNYESDDNKMFEYEYDYDYDVDYELESDFDSNSNSVDEPPLSPRDFNEQDLEAEYDM